MIMKNHCIPFPVGFSHVWKTHHIQVANYGELEVKGPTPVNQSPDQSRFVVGTVELPMCWRVSTDPWPPYLEIVTLHTMATQPWTSLQELGIGVASDEISCR